jgi:autotransporter translocation and assembly factor TamB
MGHIYCLQVYYQNNPIKPYIYLFVKQHHRCKLKGLLLFTIVICLLLSGVYVFREIIIAPQLSRLITRIVKTELGPEVHIESIKGTYWNSLVVENLQTLYPAVSKPLTHLGFKRLECHYSLLSLFGGFDHFINSSRVLIQTPDIVLNLINAEAADEDKDLPSELIEPFALPPIPQVVVRKASLTIQGAGFRTFMGEMDIDAGSHQTEELRLNLGASRLDWEFGAISKQGSNLNLVLSLSHSGLTVEQLAIGDKKLQLASHIALSDLPSSIPISLSARLAEASIDLEGLINPKAIGLKFMVHRFNIEKMLDLVADQDLMVAGILSADGNLNIPFDDSGLITGKVNLSLDKARYQTLLADSLKLNVVAEGGVAHLLQLDLAYSKNKLHLNDVTIPQELLFKGEMPDILRSLQGTFNLEANNIPPILCLFEVGCSQDGGNAPPHELLLSGRMQDGTTVFSKGRLKVDGNGIDLSSAKITWPPSGALADAALDARLSLGANNLSAFSSILNLPPLSGILAGNGSFSGSLVSPRGQVRLKGENIAYRNFAMDRLDVNLGGDLNSVTVNALNLKIQEDYIEGRGRIDFKKQALDNVDVVFSLTDPGNYIIRAGFGDAGDWQKRLSTLQGFLDGKLTLNGPFTKPKGKLAVDLRALKLNNQPIGNVSALITGDKGHIHVAKIDIANREDVATLTGSYHLNSHQISDVHLKFRLNDIKPYADLLSAGSASVQGAVDGVVQANGALLAPDASVTISSSKIRWGDSPVSDIRVKASSSKGVIVVEQIAAATMDGVARLSGTIKHDRAYQHLEANLSEFYLKWKKDALALERTAVLKISQKRRFFEIDALNLNGSLGEIQINGQAGYDKPADLSIKITDLSGKGWLSALLANGLRFQKLNAAIRLKGTLGKPQLMANGTITQLTNDNIPDALTGQFDLDYQPGLLTINTFDWVGRGDTRITASGAVPLQWGATDAAGLQPLALKSSVNLPEASILNFLMPDRLIANGAINGNIQIKGNWQRPVGSIHLEVKHLQWSDNQVWLPPGPFDMVGDLVYQGQNLNLERIKLDSPTLSFTGTGAAEGLPAIHTLFEIPYQNIHANVAFKGTLNASDLSWIASRVSGLRRLRGRLQADVAVGGPLPKPRLQVSLKIDDGELRANADVPAISSVKLRAKATEQTIDIETIEGLLGGAAVRVTGNLNQFMTSQPRIDLQVAGENLLLYRGQGIRIRGDTDLSLKGPLDKLNLSGKVAVSEGRITKYFDILSAMELSAKPNVNVGLQLFTITDPPLRDMQFNVAVTAHKPIVIRNNVLSSEIIPNLMLRGTGLNPFLVGRVFVNNSLLRLPAGNLTFESGLVQFTERNPDKPEMNLVGSTRMMGYDITVSVDGVYNEPVITMSSLPPLSDTDLVMLLVAGQPPSRGNSTSGDERRLSSVAVYLGRDLLMRWFGDDDVDSGVAILDRFSVEVGRDISNRGEETLEASFRLTENLFKKGDTLYITGERDVFDFYNAGLRLVFRFK